MVLQINKRTSAVDGPPVRQVRIRASSLGEENRTFTAIVASEKPVTTFDFRTGELIDEVLLVTGAVFPTSVPLLDSHQRSSTADVIGSMNSFRSEGTAWIGDGRVVMNDPHCDTVWAKIRGGHLNSFSIGFRILEYSDIRPGGKEVVAGRTFKNESDISLRIVTKWEVYEVSLVAIPADSNAKIRAANQENTQRSLNTMSLPTPAIHSRESVTGRPSRGALVSSQLIRCGQNNPDQIRADLQGNSVARMASCEQFERDAEEGQRLAEDHILNTMRALAEMDGVNIGVDRSEVLYKISQNYSQRGALSTSNMGSFFSQVFGSLFLVGWDGEDDTTAGWTSESDNLTMRRTSRERISPFSLPKKRGQGETATSMSVEAASEYSRLAEYSGDFTIDQQDLINNQFGNFEQLMPQHMGAAAKRLRPDLVYSALLANRDMRDDKALFHADHQNLQTASPLSDASLSAAQSMIGKQTENGTSLNLRGRYIIVPQKLERVAAKLAKEVELLDGESTPPPVVRSESRLDNGVLDPDTDVRYDGSDTDWFVSAAGNNHTIEVQYLHGTGRQPQIRHGFLKEGRFGVWFDVEHFIGAKAIDWRGLVKSEG